MDARLATCIHHQNGAHILHLRSTCICMYVGAMISACTNGTTFPDNSISATMPTEASGRQVFIIPALLKLKQGHWAGMRETSC